MTMSANLTREQAVADCTALAQTIGRGLAKGVMEVVIIAELQPDEMSAAIDDVMSQTRQTLLSAGGDPNDIEWVMAVAYKALVSEGRRLATVATWEGGSA